MPEHSSELDRLIVINRLPRSITLTGEEISYITAALCFIGSIGHPLHHNMFVYTNDAAARLGNKAVNELVNRLGNELSKINRELDIERAKDV